MPDQTEVQAAAILAQTAIEPKIIDGIPFVILTNDEGHQDTHSLEEYLKSPARRKAAVKTSSVEAFIAYAKAYRTDSVSISGDPDGGIITCVLDYHKPGPAGAAAWGEHSVILGLRKSREWEAWISRDRKAMTQIDFAEFLEDRLLDVVEPESAKLLEIATQLSIRRGVAFKSGMDLSDGTFQFAFSETADASAKGELTVPKKIVLGIPIYKHEDPIRVQARLRYRLDQEKLTFTYLLDRPEDLRDSEFGRILARIESELNTVALLK